jgi:F-type H+-transporting ATPase subunit delta
MSVTRIANRYAQALLSLSIEQNSLEKVNADMLQLSEICRESKDFENLLNSPIVDSSKKLEIFNLIFGAKMEKISVDFMNLIIQNSRESMMPSIAASFIDLYKENQNILDVTVIAADKLDENTKGVITDKIKQSYNGTIVLIEKIDPTLIGGFIVRIGDKQIDASIANQLANLKNILLN